MDTQENKHNMQEETVEELAEQVREAADDMADLKEDVQELEDTAIAQNKQLSEELEKQKKEYLFLMAEFDNFRKRTLKEKSELIKTAAENALKGMLPIMDDFERGIKASEQATDVASVKEGTELIYNKFKKYLEQNGVQEIDPEDRTFDTSKHEAISVVPVPGEEQKGKILDTVQKGYTINGKVMRHAKVVVGQ